MTPQLLTSEQDALIEKFIVDRPMMAHNPYVGPIIAMRERLRFVEKERIRIVSNCIKAKEEATELTTENRVLREQLEGLVEAWNESYDCSSDPGHNIMGSAISRAVVVLNSTAEPAIPPNSGPSQAGASSLEVGSDFGEGDTI